MRSGVGRYWYGIVRALDRDFVPGPEFTLTPTDSGAFVTVNHRLLPDEHVESHQQGWLMFLAHLQPTNKPRSRQHNQ